MGVETPEEWATALWRRLEGAPRSGKTGFAACLQQWIPAESRTSDNRLAESFEEERLLEFHTDTASEKWTSLEKRR